MAPSGLPPPYCRAGEAGDCIWGAGVGRGGAGEGVCFFVSAVTRCAQAELKRREGSLNQSRWRGVQGAAGAGAKIGCTLPPSGAAHSGLSWSELPEPTHLPIHPPAYQPTHVSMHLTQPNRVRAPSAPALCLPTSSPGQPLERMKWRSVPRSSTLPTSRRKICSTAQRSA